MDENALEESLIGYNEQLVQIEEALATSDAVTKLELYDLEKDLKELIKVTEESLLSLKKGKLLGILSDKNNLVDGDDIFGGQTQTAGESSKNEETTEESSELDFVGTKCRVKYTQEWGTVQYYNAMVLSYQVDEDNDDLLKVKVLFLNPTHEAMVPCKYFLDGKCSYGEECRYSHGYQVDANELKEYEEPDFSGLNIDSKCLAKYDNDIWYKATIRDIHEDHVTVSYDTYSETAVLDFHSILPITLNSDPASSSSSDDETDTDATDQPGFAQLTYKPASQTGPLGGWEEHTRGIGSKLMLKMGYRFGKGLGKNEQGKVEPVVIRLLPPGKSLDAILELREKGFIKDPTKKKKVKNDKFGDQQNKGTTTAAFDLINRLTHKKGSHHGGHSSHHSHKVKFGVEDSYKLLKKGLSRQKTGHVRQKEKHSNINVHIFKNNEKILTVKKKLAKQKEALARNPGDTHVSRTIKKNIELTQHELNELEKIEKSLHDKQNMKHQSKKLSIF
ncbi:zinc finger CCCH-type with G patch domain-containing protein-like [Hydractinia symbiolongicarpus]|uniref:zinc finger CCCH-type with G patch domain-containing protein-like n=1 Tax=Hydractinia symbiolongicarpus TaxID=13093 RepID=UPI0025505F9A|nr:zinc finger CCCH-type with G patch domain-containing protein-like [Hydractinia symbiolongicarpus]